MIWKFIDLSVYVIYKHNKLRVYNKFHTTFNFETREDWGHRLEFLFQKIDAIYTQDYV